MLVILVLNDRDVQNRVIHLDKSFSDQELAQAANLLNQEFGGRPLMDMREAVSQCEQIVRVWTRCCTVR